MKYSIPGFPRIGEKRELKFATEKYFRSEITEKELKETVSTLRQKQHTIQKEKGASFIPSNDFSLYDGMLDTIFTLNAIPKRYTDLNLSDLDTYFAMAHGYQTKNGDVKALTMKKWFNTNYHYLVPELEDDMQLCLRSESFLEDFLESRSAGIITRPVIIGPFTFVKLAKSEGLKDKNEFIPAIKKAWCDILAACEANDVPWLQIDEPSLVMDLSAEDILLFEDLYTEILAAKNNVNVLLQTYFGDVRDCYEQILVLPFDGIGIDFVEGEKSLELVTSSSFPEDKTLFVGLVNGKNIWRNNYKNTLETLGKISATCKNTVLSTSCSLIYVPYTIKNEPDISEDILKHFSFAYEKLDELNELCRLFELADFATDPAYIENQKLFAPDDSRTDAEVQEKINTLTEDDFNRKMPRLERRNIQKELFNLPLLPTTTIGSFPQTKQVRQNRSKYKKGEISESEYKDNIKGYIKDCINLQEEIGLDVLVHGEFERNDMVEFFGENLSGFVFTSNAWVQSYGTRGVKPPIVFKDINRKKSITTEYIAYANSITEKDVKGMLTGPVTILNWSFPREDISTKEMMYQIALAIREEVLELEAAGVRVIQIDEAALREKLPLRKCDWNDKYLDFAIKAFRLCHAKVKPETQIHTHMCYSEFGDIIPAIDAMDADVITFEASRSKLTILDSLVENNFETEVGPGVYDIHSSRIPGVEEIETALKTMLTKIPKESLWVNPDCGLKTRGEEETVASLKNLVQAAKNIRAELES